MRGNFVAPRLHQKSARSSRVFAFLRRVPDAFFEVNLIDRRSATANSDETSLSQDKLLCSAEFLLKDVNRAAEACRVSTDKQQLSAGDCAIVANFAAARCNVARYCLFFVGNDINQVVDPARSLRCDAGRRRKLRMGRASC